MGGLFHFSSPLGEATLPGGCMVCGGLSISLWSEKRRAFLFFS